MNTNPEAVIGQFAESIGREAAFAFSQHILLLGLQSPIEKMMGAAILYLLTSRLEFGRDETGDYTIAPAWMKDSFDELAPGRLDAKISSINVKCQFRVGSYRADFFVDCHHETGGHSMGVIECDGHEFHERTKEQAQRDKARDRYFQRLGLMVLRFTGSEIVRDPLGVAKAALGIFMDRAMVSAPKPRT